MVNPIQITQPQAYSGGADFTPLSKLYDVYKESQQRAMQEAALGRLGDDPIANRQALTASGVLPLAKLGIGMQDTEIARRREDITAAQAQQNFMMQQKLREQDAARSGGYLTIAQQQEKRAAEKAVEDTPEGRAAKLTAVGVDPKDPNYREYLVTGQNPPNIVQQQQAAKAKYEFDQAQKYDTVEKRRQAVKDGDLDIKDPTIARWVGLGGDPPDITKGRLGLTPVYIQNNTTGEVKALQLRNDQPTETPEGWTLLGPGQVAQQKAEGGTIGKIVAKAVTDLPKVEADAGLVVKTIDKALAPHEGKKWSVGTIFKDVPAPPGSATANYRAILAQLDSQTFLDAYNSLRGGGHISDYEDKRASGAKARLSTAQSPEEFDNALREYKEIIQSGVERARKMAARSVMTGGTATAPAAATAKRPSLDDLIPLK